MNYMGEEEEDRKKLGVVSEEAGFVHFGLAMDGRKLLPVSACDDGWDLRA